MIQKEVADRIAEKPGSKVYGILSVLLQVWYDIEYVLSVGPGAFVPPPKVHSAVIRLRRNGRTSLGCDERLFKQVVKTAFNQRRKTLRNALKPLLGGAAEGARAAAEATAGVAVRAAAPDLSDPIFDLRAERLSVEDFIRLTRMLEVH